MSKIKRERVIVITGASAGVGRAIAQEFAQQGAKLGLLARGEEKLDSTVDEVRKLGGEALACAVDVSDENKLEEAAIEIENKFGPIDIWINNAMVTALGPVSKMTSEEIKRVSDVNYLGSVNGILVANRRFLKRNHGHIIQIGSALAYLSIPLQSAYCASKHAIRGFIQSYRIELKASKSQVKISEVHLPAVNTPQFEWMTNHMPEHPMPVPPIFEPEVIGRAVAFIADHPRKEMWVGAPTVKTILGAKFAPWLAEWKLARDGIDDQQTKKAPPTQLSNLWAPVSIDFGARGMFSPQAKKHSIQLWLSMHRKKLGAAGMLVISGLIALLNSRPKKRNLLK